MELISGLADNDGVAGVVTSCGAATEGGALSKDVDKLALALVTGRREGNEE